MSRTESPLRRGLPPAAAGIPVPADKRFRRSDVRQGRRRSWRQVLVRVAWFGGGALLVLGLLAWLGSAFIDAAVLRVNHLVVRGNARLSTADVDTRLEGLLGQSILRVDLAQYQQRLLASSWVESAELWRVLPSTVQVRIVERTPLAVARLRGQLFLVDAQGVIIDKYGPQYRDFDLPIVDGLVTDKAESTVVNADGIRLIQRLFHEVSARTDLFHRVSQVDVSDPRNAVVLLEGERAQLRLGDSQFLARLARYEEMAPSLRDQPPAEYYELRFGDRIWVK